MEEEKKNTAIDFLNKMYLPGYLTLQDSGKYIGNEGIFQIKPVEPQVTLLSDRYLTPRGAHIIISQASYCLLENIAEEGLVDLGTKNIRKIALDGRLKLVELNQKFRREIQLDEKLEGKFVLTGYRGGRMPIIKMSFDLGNKAIFGSLTGVIASCPTPQANADILRG